MISRSWSSRKVRMRPGVDPVVGEVDAIVISYTLNPLFLFFLEAFAPARTFTLRLYPRMTRVVRNVSTAHPCTFRGQLMRLAFVDAFAALVVRSLLALFRFLRFGDNLLDLRRWMNLFLRRLPCFTAAPVLANLLSQDRNAEIGVYLRDLIRGELVFLAVLLDDLAVVA